MSFVKSLLTSGAAAVLLAIGRRSRGHKRPRYISSCLQTRSDQSGTRESSGMLSHLGLLPLIGKLDVRCLLCSQPLNPSTGIQLSSFSVCYKRHRH